MTAKYVRAAYGIDYQVGERVRVDGRGGQIVSFPDAYLGVRFDGQNHVTLCHPTWKVERRVDHLYTLDASGSQFSQGTVDGMIERAYSEIDEYLMINHEARLTEKVITHMVKMSVDTQIPMQVLIAAVFGKGE